MKPLIFLTTRSIVNGIKRAITTPRRLISVILFVAYYWWIFIRPAMTDRNLFGHNTQLPAPPMQMLESITFGVFVLLSIILMLGIFSQLGGFRPADVDVLFPTPVKPGVVLAFRIIRDYFTTLMVPLIFMVLLFRPAHAGWNVLFRNMPDPDASGLAIKMFAVAWMLMALVWVCIGYSVSLFTNRSDTQSDRNKRVLGWTLATTVILVLGYVYWRVTTASGVADAMSVTESPILRVFFFTATFATQMVMGALTSEWPTVLIGGLSMLGICLIMFRLALSQSGWMYDQAAAKGFGSQERRQLQQRGDVYAVLAAQAKERKIKPGRRTFFHRLRWQGPAALLWKELFLQWRGMKFMLIMMMLISIFMNVMPALAEVRRPAVSGNLVLLMQIVTVVMATLSFAQTGFIEMIRRVDVQKPLPFSPATTVLMEVVSKAALGVVASWASCIAIVVINWSLAGYALAALVGAPFAAVMISATTFLITIMFPEQDDPSQRTLRGLLLLLAIAVLIAVPTLVSVGMLYLGMPPVVAALPFAGICFGMTLLLSTIGGQFYLRYNPTE
jgi:hypothetical protein